MVEYGDIDGQPIVSVMPLHFDVPGHYLPLTTFVETANQTRAVIDGFNRELFDGQLKFEFFVLPPEPGSFKAKLGVALLAGWGMVWTFTESDIGKSFIEGLTGHDPSYWAKEVGTYARTKLPELTTPDTVPSADRLEPQTKFETTLITEATKSFLQADQDDLRTIGLTPRAFRDAYEARNRFYQACAADAAIHALGFEEAETFPIKRRDFARLQVLLPPKDPPAVDPPWEVEITTLKVTSPNWDREDRQRQWKGRDLKNRERFFRIEDEQFWHLLHAQKLNPSIIDTIKVQWAYVGHQRRNARVLRVVQFNETILGEPLDDNALRALLGEYNQESDHEDDLFGR